VFLDFDGVIVTAHDGFTNGDQYCVWHLNRITKDTDAKIVVSSSWRCGMSVPELQELLSKWGVTGEVIDKTPRLNGQRGHEIQAWLDQHPEVTDFVILDDDSDMAHLLKKRVKCHRIHGLDSRQADKSIAMLAQASEGRNG
jgi:hypothetical protein